MNTKIDVQDSVYQELRIESVKQNKSIGELIDLALVKYLPTAFLMPARKPIRRIRKYDRTNWLNKRISFYDSAYRLLEQESQRTGQPIQYIATNAFIQYLQNVNSQANTGSD
ncbi:MAG: hypothetical protein ACRC2J_18340 [Microcoleaceae cyanobacterium]